MSYFNINIGLHAQIGAINQIHNREITQRFGLHIRWVAFKKDYELQYKLTR
jgi:hypothetical protein